MPITQEQAQQAIVDAVRAVGFDVVLLARADAIRPASAYATVDWISDVGVGYPDDSNPAAIVELREARVQVASYGPDVLNLLSALRVVAISPRTEIGRALRVAGVVPQRAIMQAFRTTAPYRTGQEPRTLLDLVIQYQCEVVTTSGVDEAAGIVLDVAAVGGAVATLAPAAEIPEVP